MGVFTQARSDNAYKEAAKARDNGREVHVVQIRAGLTHINELSRPIPDMAQQIEAIESAGWRLDRTTFVDNNNKATLYAIFRAR